MQLNSAQRETYECLYFLKKALKLRTNPSTLRQEKKKSKLNRKQGEERK